MMMHLLESTLILIVALIVSRAPRLTAATRHAMVFAALMKFAIPSTLITLLLQRFGASRTMMISIAFVGKADRMLSTPAPAHAIWPAVLIVTWLFIAAALIA